MSKVRVRFPPSPTGYFHLGNARTAIFNWLFARKEKGVFVLRIEDTDPTRSKPEYEKAMIEDLVWMGLSWDEGPNVGGPHAPYRQSERFSLYQNYAKWLLDNEKAYECFCQIDDLERERAKALESGAVPRYSRKCRDLSVKEKSIIRDKGIVPALRMKTPLQGEIIVEDIIRGKLSFNYQDLDDFVILRGDGSPTYNYAVVIDDYLMEITHVVRGEDHLHGNTPRQIVVYQKLGWNLPYFGHLPMVLGKDKTKLSKRHGAMAVHEYRSLGYLPQSLTNYLALLGWSAGDERELFTLEELIAAFDLSRVGKSPAIFDEDKLKWINHHHINNLNDDEYWNIAFDFILKSEMPAREGDEKLKELVRAIKSSIHMFEELPARVRFYYISPENIEITEQEKEVLVKLRNTISNWQNNFDFSEAKDLLNGLANWMELPRKNYLPLLRKVLTGEDKGIELHLIISSLGKTEIVKRIDAILTGYEKN